MHRGGADHHWSSTTMAEPGTLKGRHYFQIFLLLLLFMFAVFTRKSIWIYYVRTDGFECMYV